MVSSVIRHLDETPLRFVIFAAVGKSSPPLYPRPLTLKRRDHPQPVLPGHLSGSADKKWKILLPRNFVVENRPFPWRASGNSLCPNTTTRFGPWLSPVCWTGLGRLKHVRTRPGRWHYWIASEATGSKGSEGEHYRTTQALRQFYGKSIRHCFCSYFCL